MRMTQMTQFFKCCATLLRQEDKRELRHPRLRACLNFAQCCFESYFRGCFPLIIRHIARYALHKKRKTSSKINSK